MKASFIEKKKNAVDALQYLLAHRFRSFSMLNKGFAPVQHVSLLEEYIKYKAHGPVL
jgi:hypothetical protein